MSTILKQPDPLSFSGNMQKFVISSTADVIFELKQVYQSGDKMILSQLYKPGSDGLVTISIGGIIEQLLEVTIPGNLNIQNIQTLATGDFIARIDNTVIPFRVIKGGVSELQEIASSWLSSHFLTWQPQHKMIPQASPEWLGIYPIIAGQLMLKAYYGDGTLFSSAYSYLGPGELYSINTSWSVVSAWLISQNQSSQVIAWDVWYEANALQVIPVQRYQLRNGTDEDNGFLWINSLGAIDSISFQGSSEEDKKLEHKNAIFADDTISEYKIENYSAVTQHTGYLNPEERWWLADFFYSTKKYVIRPDGVLQRVAITESEIISNSQDDEHDYTFTYRLGSDNNLLNLERSFSPMSAPEGLNDFFLSELLSGLTEALYMGNLLIAVQNPFALGWQKLSLEQLRIGILGSLAIGGIDDNMLDELKKYIDGRAGNGVPDTRSILLSGAIMWESGLTFKSTKLEYKLIGEDYQISSRTIVLDPADPAFPRIDVFYVDSSSEIGVLRGTPAFVPVKPIVGEYTLEITQAFIPAGATEPDVDIETVFDEKTPGEWTPSGINDNDISINFDATTTPVTGTKHIEVKLSIPDTTAANPTHYIGEKLCDGIVFYLALGGKSGLIAAECPSSPGGGVFYESLNGGGYTTGANHSEIGGGLINTSILMVHHNAKNYAAKYAANYSKDGFTGWFMGSRDEMEQLYFRKSLFPNLNGWFWTSEEVEGQYNWKRAFVKSFDNGVAYIRDKNNAFGVVPMRAFNDDLTPIGVPVEVYTPSNTVLNFAAPAPIDFSNGIVSFWLKSSVEWLANTSLTIRLFNDSERIGHLVMSKKTGMHGFNPADPQWQLIGIQSSQFSMTGTTINNVAISLVNSWPNNIMLNIDRIRIQHDSHQIPVNLIKSGIYGGVTKHTLLTVNAQGNITKIKEVDTTPVDELLTGTVDGINKVFATDDPFESGSIVVFVNGIKERHFTILSDTQIELDEAPKNIGFTDLIEAIYIKKTL